MPDAPIRLTSLAHGGGCGCKIAPSLLTDIMASLPATGRRGATDRAERLLDQLRA